MQPVNATTRIITGTDTTGAKVDVDWEKRYHYADLQKQFKDLNEAYPKYSELSTIGKTWLDRDMMCMTITDESVSDKNKIETAVFGNIHGGEGESAACAMYSAWYLLENSGNKQIQDLLKNYIIYVIPVINPDGYEQSFLVRTRENANPFVKDPDGDGIPYNDNAKDINHDGMIGTVSALSFADPENPKTAGTIGTESSDDNGDGILGNDLQNSGIDLNRNFDYKWGEDGRMDTEGPSAASEPETQAVQDFLAAHSDIKGLVTLHTGIQTVLYPWGWQSELDDPDNAEDIAFMKETSNKMAKACAVGTKRNFYAKQSYYDYQTYSELIDYAYGLYGMHSYTIEVYCGGQYKDRDGNLLSKYNKTYDPLELGENRQCERICSWNDTLPAKITKNYSHERALGIFEANGIDPEKVQVSSGRGSNITYRPWGEDEGIQISYSAEQQMRGKAPEDQDEMVTGVMHGIMAMFDSEEAGIAQKKIANAKAAKVYGVKAVSKNQRFTVTWKKNSDVTGYQVKYARKGSTKYYTLKSTTYTKAVSKKLKRGVTYKFKVRPYTTIDGTKYYGKYSSVVVKKCR